MELIARSRSGGGAMARPPAVAVRGDGRRKEEEEKEEGEPLSPLSRVFLEPRFNCHILCVMGGGETVDPVRIKEGIRTSLLAHPRFSSRQVQDDEGIWRWVPTEVDLDNHVICPELEDTIDDGSQYISNYLSFLTTTPMDNMRPLWEVHILNVPTASDHATAIVRLHHSLGDGSSLISLLLACTRKMSDPTSIPTIPTSRPKNHTHQWGIRWLLRLLVMLWNTILDMIVISATALWLRDSETPLKGRKGVEARAKRFVHRAVEMEELKVVRNVVGGTINDVLLGITSAGIVRYLRRRSGGDAGSKCCTGSKIRLRSTVLVSIRKTPGIRDLYDMMEGTKKITDWGNRIGYVILDIPTVYRQNPLDYVKAAKVISERKKSSLEALFSFYFGKLMVKLFGTKFAETLCYRVLSNTTISLSNIVGPAEEISFYGHPVHYMAPSVYGHPQALTIHYMSYMGKMEIVLAVDESVIPDADDLLNDFVESLTLIKNAATIAN